MQGHHKRVLTAQHTRNKHSIASAYSKKSNNSSHGAVIQDSRYEVSNVQTRLLTAKSRAAYNSRARAPNMDIQVEIDVKNQNTCEGGDTTTKRKAGGSRSRKRSIMNRGLATESSVESGKSKKELHQMKVYNFDSEQLLHPKPETQKPRPALPLLRKGAKITKVKDAKTARSSRSKVVEKVDIYNENQAVMESFRAKKEKSFT